MNYKKTFLYLLFIALGVGGLSCAPSGEDESASITNQQHSTDFDHFKIESIRYTNDAVSSNIIYFVMTFTQNVKPGIIDDIAALDIAYEDKAFLSLPEYQNYDQAHKWTWVSSNPKVIKGKITFSPTSAVSIGNTLRVELNQFGLEKIKDEKDHPLYIDPDPNALKQTLPTSGTGP